MTPGGQTPAPNRVLKTLGLHGLFSSSKDRLPGCPPQELTDTCSLALEGRSASCPQELGGAAEAPGLQGTDWDVGRVPLAQSTFPASTPTLAPRVTSTEDRFLWLQLLCTGNIWRKTSIRLHPGPVTADCSPSPGAGHPGQVGFLPLQGRSVSCLVSPDGNPSLHPAQKCGVAVCPGPALGIGPAAPWEGHRWEERRRPLGGWGPGSSLGGGGEEHVPDASLAFCSSHCPTQMKVENL